MGLRPLPNRSCGEGHSNGGMGLPGRARLQDPLATHLISIRITAPDRSCDLLINPPTSRDSLVPRPHPQRKIFFNEVWPGYEARSETVANTGVLTKTICLYHVTPNKP